MHSLLLKDKTTFPPATIRKHRVKCAGLPQRVVIHKRFPFQKQEIDGFPVRRGVCFAVNVNTAYLYTHGIAPSVKNANLRYIQGGKSILAPLKIVKHYGNGDLV